METEKSSLSGAEVCSIIEASAKAGLSELSFGELKISFVPKFGQSNPSSVQHHFETPLTPEQFAQIQQYPLTPSPYAKMSEDQHKILDEREIELEELRLKAEQLAELQLTDPLKYEQLIAEGDLDGRVNDDHGDTDTGE